MQGGQPGSCAEGPACWAPPPCKKKSFRRRLQEVPALGCPTDASTGALCALVAGRDERYAEAWVAARSPLAAAAVPDDRFDVCLYLLPPHGLLGGGAARAVRRLSALLPVLPVLTKVGRSAGDGWVGSACLLVCRLHGCGACQLTCQPHAYFPMLRTLQADSLTPFELAGLRQRATQELGLQGPLAWPADASLLAGAAGALGAAALPLAAVTSMENKSGVERCAEVHVLLQRACLCTEQQPKPLPRMSAAASGQRASTPMAVWRSSTRRTRVRGSAQLGLGICCTWKGFRPIGMHPCRSACPCSVPLQLFSLPDVPLPSPPLSPPPEQTCWRCASCFSSRASSR